MLLILTWVCLLSAIAFTILLLGTDLKRRQQRERLAIQMLPRDRRRSRRLTLSVPVFVYGWASGSNPFIDITNTLSVSVHGGSIALPALVQPGQIVLLSNVYTNEEKECRIVRVGPEHEGKRDVGFEFLDPEGWFWWKDFDS